MPVIHKQHLPTSLPSKLKRARFTIARQDNGAEGKHCQPQIRFVSSQPSRPFLALEKMAHRLGPSSFEIRHPRATVEPQAPVHNARRRREPEVPDSPDAAGAYGFGDEVALLEFPRLVHRNGLMLNLDLARDDERKAIGGELLT